MDVMLLAQEFQPSGPQGKSITIGEFVRDILLEQVGYVSECPLQELQVRRSSL
jgi:hypothetical protein